MILLIDNYDSFVHNLARAFRELGQDTHVVRNDAINVADVTPDNFDAVVLSPGPCTPAEAGICVPLLQATSPDLPILGVCLGHQAIAVAFGGSLERTEPVHGRATPVWHDGRRLFEGLPKPFAAARYHSLAVRKPLPAALGIDATGPDGCVMALSHKERPVFGVQFHPESILTECGNDLLANFLRLASAFKPAACLLSS